jgi:hypothetical protein
MMWMGLHKMGLPTHSSESESVNNQGGKRYDKQQLGFEWRKPSTTVFISVVEKEETKARLKVGKTDLSNEWDANPYRHIRCAIWSSRRDKKARKKVFFVYVETRMRMIK